MLFPQSTIQYVAMIILINMILSYNNASCLYVIQAKNVSDHYPVELKLHGN